MAKPTCVCAKCGCEMQPEKNGVKVLFMAAFGPYEIWCGDSVKCPKCEAVVVVGWGQDAYARHFQENFNKELNEVDIIVEALK